MPQLGRYFIKGQAAVKSTLPTISIEARELAFAQVPKMHQGRLVTGWKTGAACVTRTRDPRITNAVLYRLS